MRWRIKWRASIALSGTVVKYLSVAMLVPLLVAILHREDIWVFAASAVIAFLIGTALERFEPDPELGPQEGFLFVSLAWLGAALVGTVPYLLAGYGTDSVLRFPTNALFESMSGFTTTGATVLEDISVSTHSHALLMWRQLTQWLGGMGIIVLMLAILPELAVNGAQLMRSEAPGPDLQKLTPRIQETARALWIVYAGLTAALIALLYTLHLAGVAPNMDLYNAIAHGFTTMPTGGFSPQAGSIGAFSPAVQWVVFVFIVFAGVNFALYWQGLHGNLRSFVINMELRTYLGAVAFFSTVVALVLLATTPVSAWTDVEGLAREAFFQVASLLNSTGYATVDYTDWSSTAQVVLLFAMFVGGSAGSTGGGIKVIRWVVTFKAVWRELLSSTTPDIVRPVRVGGRVVREPAVRGMLMFTLIYLALFAVSTGLLSLDAFRAGQPLSALEAISASLATIGNIGPGFGAVGPFGTYNFFPSTSKAWMTFLMWVGRLEIVPVLGLIVRGFEKAR